MNPSLLLPIAGGLLGVICYNVGLWMGRCSRDRECSCPQVDANEILCRVFPPAEYDGVREAWLAWYQPYMWLHPSRALGAFIAERLYGRDHPLRPPFLRESYWCGCLRTARWTRCAQHQRLEHDEEPPKQREATRG